MKCTTLIKFGIGLVCFGGLTSPALKADPKNRHSHQQILEQSEEERVVYLTGSNIPQKVKVKSIGTDSARNVRIFTQAELLSTGRPTVGEALALDPSIQISGRH
jgi:hypothetical protein